MFRFVPIRSFTSAAKPSASKIRQSFIDYFVKDNTHSFIKSSSVIPYGDPSVPFVNAGMNQFKSVLLGIKPAPVPRAANSQKCIRVGGKHNDLEEVGKDGTHHTFFEMLGNWSFGDYFKAEACSLAWNLLTGPLRLDPTQLVVTYFGGDDKEGLPADEECAHAWRSLGVSGSQLVPCGMKDNFWEMGPVGPCGPCTEIHLKHDDGLLELWNLVFIEYERRVDHSLIPLSTHHVDTGMGLERLSKVLQKVPTNYDTDLFSNHFSLIQKASKAPSYTGKFGVGSELDCAYRVLADHSRAISIALGDGMFPDQNPKLRRLVRRCLLVSEQNFNLPGSQLISDLMNLNAETLGQVYPELQHSLNRCLHLVTRESEAFVQSRRQTREDWQRCIKQRPELTTLSGDHPGLVAAVSELKGKTEINGETAYKLYDTYGLEINTIESLASCLRLPLDLAGMQRCMENQQASSRTVVGSEERILKSLNIPATDDSLKYVWSLKNNQYIFPSDTSCEVLAVLASDNQVVSSVTAGTRCKLVLDKTCCYSESGGQVSDTGELVMEHGRARIENVQKLGEYIFHYVTITEGEIKTSERGNIKVDSTSRLASMQHHSATHLLNSALHSLLPATYQRSSHVTPNYLTFDFTIYNKDKLENKDIAFLENYIIGCIKKELPIDRKLISISELPQETVLIPGEHYPEEVFVLQISDGNGAISIEPCCGTHCSNTKHIIDFCIVTEKSSGVGVRSLRAVAGNNAVNARLTAKTFSQELQKLQESQGDVSFVEKLQEFKRNFKKVEIPLLERQILSQELEDLDKKVVERLRREAKSQVEQEMSSLLSSNNSSAYIVHAMVGHLSEPLPLAPANAMCLPDRASFIFSLDADDNLRARCTVPIGLVTEDFNAEKWVQSVLSSLSASGSTPKGQDPKLVFLVKPKRISKTKQEDILFMAVTEAKKFLISLGYSI